MHPEDGVRPGSAVVGGFAPLPRGENVYSAEVENALALHDAVAACAVIGIPDDDWGERVHAVVILKPGTTATGDELRDFCRSHIANYKIPRSVEFTESLPLSGAGKILKRELRKQYWDSAERAVHRPPTAVAATRGVSGPRAPAQLPISERRRRWCGS